MKTILASEWRKAIEESSRAVAFRPHPRSKSIREIAKESGYSIRNVQHTLIPMIEKGDCKRLEGTTITGEGRRRACSYYLLRKDMKCSPPKTS